MTGPFYPSLVATFTTKEDDIDIYAADHINYVQAEINAIESNIGTNPQGSKGSLAERLAVMIGTSGAIFSSSGFPASPILGQLSYRSDNGILYVYNGASWDSLVSTQNVGGYAFAPAFEETYVYNGAIVARTAVFTKFSGLDSLRLCYHVKAGGAGSGRVYFQTGGAVSASASHENTAYSDLGNQLNLDISGLVSGSDYTIQVYLQTNLHAYLGKTIFSVNP